MNETIITVHKTSALLVRMEPDTKKKLMAASRKAKKPATVLVRDLIKTYLKAV